jgi:DNA-binding CsgD family transcriptional regulator
MLSGLTDGVFLVDSQARIVFANAAGHALLLEAKIVRGVQSTFAATDPKATEILHHVFTAAGMGDEAVGIKGIAVPLRATDGEQWLAHVLPLTSGARKREGVPAAASAAVFVRKSSLQAPSAMETVSKLYKLTPSELRVLLAVVEVGGGPAVAKTLGISEKTVKTHLQSLFVKTGTHRQADLVKLVAGASSPFAR